MFVKTAVDFIFEEILVSMALDQTGFSIYPEESRTYLGTDWLIGGVIPSLELSLDLTQFEAYNAVGDWYHNSESVRDLMGIEIIVGGWVHNGVIHLDLITTTESQAFAEMLGELYGQIAIGHKNIDGTFTELELTK